MLQRLPLGRGGLLLPLLAWAAAPWGGGAVQEDGSCAAGDATCSSAAAAAAEEPPHGQQYFWPQQKGDVNRTGRSPWVMPFDISKGPTWVWKDPHREVIRFTPLIDDKKNVYLGTLGGRVYKFSPDGEILWKHQATDSIPAVPALMDGKLFYNLRTGTVVALDMETGGQAWRKQISHATAGDTACIFVVEGLVISDTDASAQPGQGPSQIGGSNNAVVALDPTNGSVVWTFAHEWASFNFQASAPGDGTMVFMDKAGGVYRVSLADGSLIWLSGVPDRDPNDFTTGAAIVGPNGLVYGASNYRGRGIIHAYQLSDGEPVWRREMGMLVNQAVTVGKVAGSDRLHVAAGIGENPMFPFLVRALFGAFLLDLLLVLLFCLTSCIRLLCRKARKRLKRHCLWFCLGLPLLLCLEATAIYVGHVQCADEHWYCLGHFLPAAFVALDAETGVTRWSYTPPAFSKPTCEGDDTFLFPRFYNIHIKNPKDFGDPICLPDNWAQGNLDAAGTAYGGHQDGYLYAIRDEDGSGTIEPDREVRRYYFGAAFQASQGMAPGMLAAAPCGGGLYVWRF